MERSTRRHDDPPTLEYDERITGSGRLIRDDVVLPVTRFSLIRHRYNPESQWEFQAYAAEATHHQWSALLTPGRRELAFDGTADGGERIDVPTLHFELQRGRELTARAQTVNVGPREVNGKFDFQHIRVDLWPTGLAVPEVLFPIRSWTGEIKVWRTSPRTPTSKVLVRLARHRLRFSKHYAWDDALVAGQASTVRIPIATLYGSIAQRRRTPSVGALCDDLERELEDLTPVLSFLSRRHIRWSRIEIVTRWRDGDKIGHDAYTRIRGSRSSYRGRKAEPLVVPGRMPEDWLQDLLTKFCAMPSRTSIASAILYLIVAHDSGFVDAAIANAYTAFETALNALTNAESAFTLNAAPFRKLSSRVRTTIREFTSEKGLGDDTCDAITAKVPELRRRAVVDRAVQYIVSSSIDIAGIWPDSVSLEQGLGAIIQRRNRFFHTGELGAVHQASIDAERLTTLTERMLAYALRVPPQWFSPIVFADAAHLSYIPEPAEE